MGAARDFCISRSRFGELFGHYSYGAKIGG